MFLDTGARINLISLAFLREAKHGLDIIEPTTFNIQGVTGNKLTPVGETQITVTFGKYYMFTLTAVVVEQQSFPGNLLIGYDTMRDEHITIIPARVGVKISYKFLPFVNTHSQDFVATVSQPRMPKAITAYKNDNVVERYLNHSSPVLHEEKTKPPQATKQSKHSALAETLKIVSGSVTESTLLQAQSICKVKVSVKGISEPMCAIVLSESSRVREINLENDLYHTDRGKTEVFVINTLHTDVAIKKGTELGRFQIGETVAIINNQDLISDKNEEIAQVFSLQESLQSERDIKQYLAPTSRPDLESELVNLLLLHKAAVAMPGDAWEKQIYCNTRSS